MGGTLKIECFLVPPVLKECDGHPANLRDCPASSKHSACSLTYTVKPTSVF